MIHVLALVGLLATSPAPGSPARGSVTSSSPPTFGSEIQHGNETDSTATTVITLSSGMSVGEHGFIVISWSSSTETVSSVTDSAGNTWTADKTHDATSSLHTAIYSAHIGTALSPGSVTIHWGSPAFTFRWWSVLKGSNVASSSYVDQTAANTSFGTSISCTASTTAANTLIIGALNLNTQTTTYSGSSFTPGSAVDGPSSFRTYYFYSNQSSSGSKDLGGSLGASDTWWATWVAYK